MAIAKKPGSSSKPDTEKDIKALIEKGGSVAITDQTEEDEEPKSVQLRLTPSWIKRIDQVRKKRPIKTMRHTWFLEAIHEKLEREGA
ncbi:MAG: hypothetical protein ACQ9MH_15315 [Nitrospinales bacterium]